MGYRYTVSEIERRTDEGVGLGLDIFSGRQYSVVVILRSW